MPTRLVTSEMLARLRDERDAADREYNAALTDVDRALPRAAALPTPPPHSEDGRLDRLDAAREVLAGTALPAPRGIRTRLAHFVWRLVRPAFERQQDFNQLVIGELRAMRAAERGTLDALGSLTVVLGDQAAALATFRSHLIRYFQQVTSYVDTKDRLEAGSLAAVYDAALDGLTDQVLRRAEAADVRAARFDGRVSAMSQAQEDLRRTVAVLQQATITLKREVERAGLRKGAVQPKQSAEPAEPVEPVEPVERVEPVEPAEPLEPLDSYKYVCFENLFRGSQSEIRERLTSYVPLFAGASDVLDVGCGRGEFLDLLARAGIKGRGIDLNHEMVEVCRERGLDAVEADLLAYLSGIPDGSLGGLIAVQVVEHLEPTYLMRALDLAFDKLRPGARIVLETINVSSWYAFFASYVRDLTHVRPLHPETLQFLLTASGFQRARVEYRVPYPASEKLQHVPAPEGVDSPLIADLIETVDSNADRLNHLLFADLDYAAIAERP
jgi:SAM-dependent methyltransferase